MRKFRITAAVLQSLPLRWDGQQRYSTTPSGHKIDSHKNPTKKHYGTMAITRQPKLTARKCSGDHTLPLQVQMTSRSIPSTVLIASLRKQTRQHSSPPKEPASSTEGTRCLPTSYHHPHSPCHISIPYTEIRTRYAGKSRPRGPSVTGGICPPYQLRT